MFSRLQKIKKQNNLYDIINSLISNDVYCPSQIGEGSFGKVYTNKIPTEYKLQLKNGKTIILRYLVAKHSNDIENESFTFRTIIYSNGKKTIRKGTEYGEKKRKKDENKYLLLKAYNTTIGEGLISVIVSKLFIDGISPHFPICIGFSRCDEYNVSVMENLSIKTKDGIVTDFNKYHEYFTVYKGIKMTAEIIDISIIMILHSIFVLQYNFSFIHMDIMFRNILIKDLKKGEQYFRGEDMTKYDYFEYIIPFRDKMMSIYVPNKGFILKIGDYGTSMMSAGKLIIDNKDDGTVSKSTLINKYYPNYPTDYERHFPDYLFIIREFLWEFGYISPLIFDLVTRVPILSDKPLTRFALLEDIDMEKSMNANEILAMNIFSKYHKKPNKGNILTINYKID
jgi:hypothetical protein